MLALTGLEPPPQHANLSLGGEGFVRLLHAYLGARAPQLSVNVGVGLELDAARVGVLHLRWERGEMY